MNNKKKKVVFIGIIFIIFLAAGLYALNLFADTEKNYSSQDSEASGGDMSKKTIYKFNAR